MPPPSLFAFVWLAEKVILFQAWAMTHLCNILLFMFINVSESTEPHYEAPRKYGDFKYFVSFNSVLNW